MSLRLKIILFVVCAILAGAAYFKFYWEPQVNRHSEQALAASVESHLSSIAQGLVSPLLQNQLANIHENLGALLAQNSDWLAVVLHDKSGRRLFPFNASEQPPGGSARTFERAIRSHDELLGRISVTVDFKPQMIHLGQIHEGLALSLGGGFALIAILLGLLIDATVRRPAEQLARAANRLAHGDFEATLPAARRDEMGTLITSFATMRDQVRSDKDTLSRARNDLEVRVRQRTAELQAINEELVESEERFKGVIENSPTSLSLKDLEGRFQFVNSKFTEWFGTQPEELVGKTVPDIWPKNHSDTVVALDRKVIETSRTLELDRDVLFADGTLHSVVVTKFPVLGPDNKIIGIGTINSDVTERVAAERTVVESRDQLRLVTDNLPALIAYTDAQQRYRFANKTCTEWFARPVEEIVGRTISEVLGQEYEKIRYRADRVLAGEQLTYVESITYPDGVTRTVQVTYVPHFGAAGSVEGFFTLAEDISELQQAEAALRQAQKMEAVGQLTGGVAHDFNNLLAVILGNTELLGDEIGEHSRLASIDHAATRGAELTQRLLAFSRQQTLAPQSIDLAELVPGLHDVLRRTLGEPVKVVRDVPEGIWPVLADPGQLENALLNLAINARDAMPGGGFLEIRCSNIELQEGDMRVSDEVAAGDYVKIAVRDTGTGMPKDVLEHVLEPFYTTKDVGKGSGLGLSMVYGFARQSGGDIVIESEPDKGTEVRLFLPRAEVTVASDEAEQEAELKRGQGETILVLEDDPDVRSLAVTALEGLGYRVLEAVDANAAMQVLEEEADNLELLLSDVVLPGGIGGPELAAKAKNLYPKLKLVFMSGYTADLYIHDKIPDFNGTLLTKPFRQAELAKAIHDTLAE